MAIMNEPHMPKTHYRWANAHEWLKGAGLSYADLMSFALDLATGDDIQLYFQTNMAYDGYFDELLDDPCPVCKDDMTVEDYVTCLDCGQAVHSACTVVVEPENPHQAVAQHRCHLCDEQREEEYDDPA